jgi:hypothetical protein
MTVIATKPMFSVIETGQNWIALVLKADEGK